MSKIIIGIDPGVNGSISFYNKGILISHNMPDTPADILELLGTYPADKCKCYMEKVHGRPGGGSSGMFNYGKGYGHIEMALIALGISTETMQPQKWMKVLGVGTRGDMSPTEWKNKLKAKAQQLFPNNKITLKTSDAALICYYGNKMENGQ